VIGLGEAPTLRWICRTGNDVAAAAGDFLGVRTVNAAALLMVASGYLHGDAGRPGAAGATGPGYLAHVFAINTVWRWS
jgi:hypothetical protein